MREQFSWLNSRWAHLRRVRSGSAASPEIHGRSKRTKPAPVVHLPVPPPQPPQVWSAFQSALKRSGRSCRRLRNVALPDFDQLTAASAATARWVLVGQWIKLARSVVAWKIALLH